ncbi:ankyrin-1-like [Xenia sp. Carnegie-2017]|uniref:ankyrin-1-like n=1 Tax=Xenia sp. Carnegie-2017 TaxID=2897299 RepID=UPI001F033FF0|nr:ankyrin-1-like [Xenia sp. Carnegie-2017]
MSNRSRKWTKLDLRHNTGNEPKGLALTPLTSIEAESETNIVERDDGKMKDANRIKLAAFNDDEKMINDILREKTSEREIQKLLAELDERGRPCIFYAVEFRSLRALTCLFNQVKDTKCVTAKNGETVLHVATEMNDVVILKKLLDQDFIVHLVNDVENKNSRSPLFFAAMYNFVDVAKVLLEHGGNITEVDGSNRSPLYIAAEKGRAGLLDLFLKHEKSRVKELLFSKEHGGKHHQNILHVAVDSGDKSTVEVCLQQDEDMIRSCLQEEMNSGGGYLVNAVRKNSMEEMLSRFIDTMGDPLVQQNKIKEELMGDSLVQHATIIEETDEALPVQSAVIIEEPMVDSLVQHDKIRLRGRKKLSYVQHDKIRLEPMELSLAQHGEIKVEPNFNHLSDEIPHSGQASPTCTCDRYAGLSHRALLLAVEGGHVEDVKELLKEKARFIKRDKNGTVLHCAVAHPKLLKILLKESDILSLINEKRTDDGYAPIHAAAKRGRVESVKILIDNHAELNVLSENQSSPLHCAVISQNLGIIKLLLDNCRKLISMANATKQTPLHTAAYYSSSRVVKYLLKYEILMTR